jgi:hypothetical protein
VTLYQDSVHALRELLPSEPTEGPSRSCRITKLSHSVSHLENGVEYCLVEVTCDDGEQYGIQAFGREAVQIAQRSTKAKSGIAKRRRGISDVDVDVIYGIA